MIAADACSAGGIVESVGDTAEIVVAIQRARAEGRAREERNLTDELIRRYQPLLRRAARRYSPRRRGGLMETDLMQVGSIEVLKHIATYDAAKSRGQTFEMWTYWRVLRAMGDQVAMRAHDVHLSDHANRGRTGERRAAIAFESIDRECDQEETERTRHARASTEGEAPTPEAELEAAQVHALVRRLAHRLPTQRREVLLWHFGVGRPAKSIRQLAVELRKPRAYIDGLLRMALAALRRAMEEADGAGH